MRNYAAAAYALVEYTMELTKNILIYSAAVAFVFVGFTLKTWITGGKQNSFKTEIRNNLIGFIVFAVIAAIIFYINN